MRALQQVARHPSGADSRATPVARTARATAPAIRPAEVAGLGRGRCAGHRGLPTDRLHLDLVATGDYDNVVAFAESKAVPLWRTLVARTFTVYVVVGLRLVMEYSVDDDPVVVQASTMVPPLSST